ncbi:MAG: hypothetical protein HYV41_05530 [Candidatus Magasanikbacteria bacterium]|nr:hypothetical protein [Candidatus Magasanikbacteria bacterium]
MEAKDPKIFTKNPDLLYKKVEDLDTFGIVEANPRRAEFDWKDETSYVDKAQDVTLLAATQYNYTWLSVHHDIRDILDAYTKYSAKFGKKLSKDFSPERLYQMLEFGTSDRLVFNVNDDFGQATGEQVDLYDLVRFSRIQEANHMLEPRNRFTDSELEQKFFLGEPLIKKIKNPAVYAENEISEIDLRTVIADCTVSREEIVYYKKIIADNQLALQMDSNLRDPSITIHHAENGGHSQFSGELGLYIPVGVEAAKGYVRADVKKQPAGFKAKGHVHEIGWYEENTSTLVKIEAQAYEIWRGAVKSTRTHEQTDVRMYHNLVGLSSGEHNPFSDRKRMSFHFGSNGKGKIYSAMKNHYNEKMNDVRGYGITKDEIGDKIATDVVGVAFALNPIDWVMSFSLASGISSPQDLIRPEAMKGEGKSGEWSKKPVFIFDALHVKGFDDVDKTYQFDPNETNTGYGKITLRGIPALRNYFQWRIERGEIPGIERSFNIAADGVTKEEEDRIDLKEKEAEDKLKNKELLKEWSVTEVDAFAEITKAVFGDQATALLETLLSGIGAPSVVMEENGKEKTYTFNDLKSLTDFVTKKLEKTDISADIANTLVRSWTHATSDVSEVKKYASQISHLYSMVLYGMKEVGLSLHKNGKRVLDKLGNS